MSIVDHITVGRRLGDNVGKMAFSPAETPEIRARPYFLRVFN